MDVPLFLNSALPPDLDNRVRSELRDGERLLWVGQPRRRWFPREALTPVLVGIPVTAFAVFWTSLASWIVSGKPGKNDPGIAFRLIFPLFGVPFILIGLALLSSPYWLRRKAKHTCYALTDRRAILFEAGALWSVSVRSYLPRSLTSMYREEYADGSGDLVFVKVHRGRAGTDTYGFKGINNVREVEALLQRALLPGHDSRTRAEPPFVLDHLTKKDDSGADPG